jgi:glucose-6-phosphate 1-epimerase
LENVGHELHFRWVPDLTHNEYWPFNTPLEVRYTLGDACEIELITRNDSPTTVTVTEALHTYFGVGDVREVTIRGLEDLEYLDKVNDNRRQHQSGPITIGGETDRVYISTQGDCFIEDPLLNRIIRIEKSGSQSTIIWNPWERKARRLGDLGETDFLRMVCVESGNVADNRISLKPGEEHRLWVRYSVSALTT